MMITLKPKIDGNKMFKLLEKIHEEHRQLENDLYKLGKMIGAIEFEEVGDTGESPTQN